MKELLSLKSFQQIVLLIFLLGFTIGILIGTYLFTGKFKIYFIIPSLPALFYISRELYRNVTSFIVDLK
ncbi:hypothetical protein SAMN05444372_10452 [Flavobacterium micromati]|uniref:Uncharacterized protein n=1 Tax=Flavobacterium micromati TaxID=229205 RepID=A0A1M5IEH7_9FLAO|nr:hypothetical protein [Flavobacterium micromati]SHG26667.1 hypothetical protein SAMN05444372_10452 [Flavobacterium micromati]